VVHDKPISEQELKNEQNNAVLAMPGQFETAAQLSGAYAQIIEYNLPEDYFNTFTQKATSVTPQDANAVAQKYIQPDHLVWVVVGDMSKVEQGIRDLNLCEIHKIDADGNALQ